MIATVSGWQRCFLILVWRHTRTQCRPCPCRGQRAMQAHQGPILRYTRLFLEQIFSLQRQELCWSHSACGSLPKLLNLAMRLLVWCPLGRENSHRADKGDGSVMSALPFIFQGIRKGIRLCWDVFCGEKGKLRSQLFGLRSSLGFCKYCVSGIPSWLSRLWRLQLSACVLAACLCNLYMICNLFTNNYKILMICGFRDFLVFVWAWTNKLTSIRFIKLKESFVLPRMSYITVSEAEQAVYLMIHDSCVFAKWCTGSAYHCNEHVKVAPERICPGRQVFVYTSLLIVKTLFKAFYTVAILNTPIIPTERACVQSRPGLWLINNAISQTQSCIAHI